MTLREMVNNIIYEKYIECGKNKLRLAKLLGISRQMVYRRIREVEAKRNEQ